MKLASEVYFEIIDIFRQALTELVDVSDRLRGLDLVPVEKDGENVLTFTDEWLKRNRGGR